MTIQHPFLLLIGTIHNIEHLCSIILVSVRQFQYVLMLGFYFILPKIFLRLVFLKVFFLADAFDVMDAKCSPGSSVGDSVETIRMTEARNDVMVEKCSRNVPTYQLKVSHAAGTILTNGEPFICGGYPRTEQCYQFVKNELELRDATRLHSVI